MTKTRSTAAKIALPLFFVAVVCICVAFSTTHWLENWSKYYGDKFDKLGLWVHCFRSLPDPHDALHLRYFTGCRWVFNPFTAGYAEMRDFLMPPFFIAVQLFFTLCFMLMLVGIAGTLMYVLCFTYEHQVKILRALAWDLTIAAFCGTIAVITFGALGDSRDWMPDFEHNFLSWSFGLAVVGTFGLYLSATLFFIEAKVQAKKQRDTTSQATFSLEHKV
uniref:Uncharacterized protein n=1 Tax=Daphnia galeata TaxID=27404 RepID=A0A8J2S3D4_9CRUS|nr:unnamed protein product [Daphnia galeata]